MKSYRTSEFVMLELRLYCCEIRGLVADWLMNGRSVIHDQSSVHMQSQREERCGKTKQHVEKLVSKLLNFKIGLYDPNLKLEIAVVW
jgi:hypothetical protein